MASAMDKQLLSILGVMQGALQGGNEATSKPILCAYAQPTALVIVRQA